MKQIGAAYFAPNKEMRLFADIATQPHPGSGTSERADGTVEPRPGNASSSARGELDSVADLEAAQKLAAAFHDGFA